MSEENSNDIRTFLCTSCGSEINGEDKVCPVCGADLSNLAELNSSVSDQGSPEPAVEPNKNEPVVLKTFHSEIDAQYLIKVLEANKISATIRLKPWSDTSGITTVLVRREDLDNAVRVVELLAKNSKPMQLGDIFSNSFTIAWKTLENNIIFSLLIIPAGILLTLSIINFFGSLPETPSDDDKNYVYTEPASIRNITPSFSETGVINSNLNVEVKIKTNHTKVILRGDIAWVNIDSASRYLYEGMVEDVYKTSNPRDTTNVSYTLIITLSRLSSEIQTGRGCYVKINSNAIKPVLSIPEGSLSLANSDDGKKRVYVVNNGKAKLKKIKTGIAGDGYIEIVSGLKEGETVIKELLVEDNALAHGTDVTVLEKLDFKFSKYGWEIIFIGIAGLACSILYLGINIGITKSAIEKMEGRNIPPGELLKVSFSKLLLRCLGLILFIGSLTLSVFFLLWLMIETGVNSNKGFLIAMAGLMFIPALLAAAYFSVRWYFAFVYIVDTGKGIFDALKKSSFLLKGNWWRTFGIIILVSLAVNFLVSLLTTPASLIFMWDYWAKSFSGELQELSTANIELLKSFTLGFALCSLLGCVIQSLILPVFNVLMYYDLRIRKHDFYLTLKQ